MRALDSPDELATVIKNVCFQGDPAFAGVITALRSRSHVLEYVFSGAFRVPTTAWEFPRPSSFLVLDKEACEKLSSALDHFGVLDTHHPKNDGHPQHETSLVAFPFVVVCRTPLHRKKGKQVSKNRWVDPFPLTDVGVRDDYLLVLIEPPVSEASKSSYTNASRLSGKVSVPQQQRRRLRGPSEESRSQPSAPRDLADEGRAPYFDDVEGFGEWSSYCHQPEPRKIYEITNVLTVRIVAKKWTTANSAQTTILGVLL